MRGISERHARGGGAEVAKERPQSSQQGEVKPRTPRGVDERAPIEPCPAAALITEQARMIARVLRVDRKGCRRCSMRPTDGSKTISHYRCCSRVGESSGKRLSIRIPPLTQANGDSDDEMAVKSQRFALGHSMNRGWCSWLSTCRRGRSGIPCPPSSWLRQLLCSAASASASCRLRACRTSTFPSSRSPLHKSEPRPLSSNRGSQRSSKMLSPG